MFDFLNQNSGAIQSISTIILVIVTIYYAIQAKKNVDEMEESRRYEFLPVIEIQVFADVYNRVRITITNIGKGLARYPKIYMPMSASPTIIQNLGPRSTKEIIIETNPAEILSLDEDKRILRVEYLDIFSRTISSEALLTAETNEQNNPRNNYLTIGVWNLNLPR